MIDRHPLFPLCVLFFLRALCVNSLTGNSHLSIFLYTFNQNGVYTLRNNQPTGTRQDLLKFARIYPKQPILPR